MPPPDANSTLPSAASITAVRMATLQIDEGLAPSWEGVIIPIAPQYRPRGDGSRRAMARMAATFGAPVIDPQGNVAANTSARPTSGRSVACTVEVSCHTVS